MPLLPPIFPAQSEQVIYSIYYENLVLAQKNIFSYFVYFGLSLYPILKAGK